jgi:hypothetical protein
MLPRTWTEGRHSVSPLFGVTPVDALLRETPERDQWQRPDVETPNNARRPGAKAPRQDDHSMGERFRCRQASLQRDASDGSLNAHPDPLRTAATEIWLSGEKHIRPEPAYRSSVRNNLNFSGRASSCVMSHASSSLACCTSVVFSWGQSFGYGLAGLSSGRPDCSDPVLIAASTA